MAAALLPLPWSSHHVLRHCNDRSLIDTLSPGKMTVVLFQDQASVQASAQALLWGGRDTPPTNSKDDNVIRIHSLVHWEADSWIVEEQQGIHTFQKGSLRIGKIVSGDCCLWSWLLCEGHLPVPPCQIHGCILCLGNLSNSSAILSTGYASARVTLFYCL